MTAVSTEENLALSMETEHIAGRDVNFVDKNK